MFRDGTLDPPPEDGVWIDAPARFCAPHSATDRIGMQRPGSRCGWLPTPLPTFPSKEEKPGF